jgi:hypothetical protein
MKKLNHRKWNAEEENLVSLLKISTKGWVRREELITSLQELILPFL